ncbi:hypothetical protein AALO_G00031490 [Alosa alosa]|uniref:Uncharacterized protein n=1 Tax=Alosa alosa TaxID=278164 RepID=A0AAV6HG89_9TELE|nr:hypothetical protein AALO_G00031490 [Alosa alosa]
MRARTELAIIDHNINIGREQKTTLEGKPQYKDMYTKTTQQWVAKPVYEPTSQDFRKDLMEDVLKLREEKSLEPWPQIQADLNKTRIGAETPIRRTDSLLKIWKRRLFNTLSHV